MSLQLKFRRYGYATQLKRISADPEIVFNMHAGDFGIPWSEMTTAQRNTRREEMRSNNSTNELDLFAEEEE